jgi:hypothetical protein
MKKIFFAGIAFLLINSSFSQPPQDHPKPPTSEERWQHDRQRINEIPGLSADQLIKLKAVFIDFYKDMDALREKMPPPPPPPLRKEEMDKILNKRNEQLKKVLTPAQLDKLSEEEKQFHNGRRKDLPPPPGKSAPSTE